MKKKLMDYQKQWKARHAHILKAPFHVPDAIVAKFELPVAVRVVNLPVVGVVAPIVVWSIAPPVIATELAFCVAIVPRPDTWLGVMEIVAFEAEVIWPWALTVITGTTEAEP